MKLFVSGRCCGDCNSVMFILTLGGFVCNYSQVNATEPLRWQVDIGSVNGLMPGTRPLWAEYNNPLDISDWNICKNSFTMILVIVFHSPYVQVYINGYVGIVTGIWKLFSPFRCLCYYIQHFCKISMIIWYYYLHIHDTSWKDNRSNFCQK